MKPEYATAIGLMYADAEIQDNSQSLGEMLASGKKAKKPKGEGFFSKLLKKFK